jgi:hypothetical protein
MEREQGQEFLRELSALCRKHKLVIRTSQDPSDGRPYINAEPIGGIKGGMVATYYVIKGEAYLDGLEYDDNASPEGELK